MKILVIDDERKLARFIKQGLEQHGHVADVTHSGSEGLDYLAGGLYDLVLLDLMLSGQTGFEVLQKEGTCTIRIQNCTLRESGPTLDLIQPYFRADPLREGHGLGFWISHRLTTMLGGALRLDWQDFTFTSTLIFPVSPTN